MKSQTSIAAVLGIAVLSFSGLASAQGKVTRDAVSDPDLGPELPPIARAIELTAATGYQQAFGNIAAGQPTLSDVGQSGAGMQVGVGYRLVPQLALGVYGSGGAFGRGPQVDSTASLYSASAGVQADYHLLPAAHQLDPWLSLGTGWRGYWMHADQGSAAGTTSLHGWEIARAQIGLDVRVDESLAISPVVGTGFSTFFAQSAPGAAYHSFASPQIGTFLFAGLQGRFDIGGGSSESSGSSRVAAR